MAASNPYFPQQQQQQQQIQQQQQRPQQSVNAAQVIISIQDKLKEMGPGPYTAEQERKRDMYSVYLAKAQESLAAQKLAKANLENDPVTLIRTLKIKLNELGPGPHTVEQQIYIKRLNQLLERATQNLSSTQNNSNQSASNSSMGGPSTSNLNQQNDMSNSSNNSTLNSHQMPNQNYNPIQNQNTQQQQPPQSSATVTPNQNQILDKRTLQDLVREVDPSEQLDEDVEEMLLQIADDFIENVINASCQLAKHRKSNTLEVKDVQFHLERNFNIWIPGFGSDELKPFKKAYSTEAHKQRLQLIKKTVKPSDAKEKN